MSKSFVRLDTFANAAAWNLRDQLAGVAKRGKAWVVEIRWSSKMTIHHEHKFDNVDDALVLMNRVNKLGRITTACWMMPKRA